MDLHESDTNASYQSCEQQQAIRERGGLASQNSNDRCAESEAEVGKI